MKKTALLIIAVLLSGCATCYTRISKASPKVDEHLYPASRVDIGAIGMLCTFEELHGMWLLAPLPAVDLIPSVVTDTVCLPYDVWKGCRQ